MTTDEIIVLSIGTFLAGVLVTAVGYDLYETFG